VGEIKERRSSQLGFSLQGSSGDLNHSNIFVDMNSAPKK
jgi:hypothetical protein